MNIWGMFSQVPRVAPVPRREAGRGRRRVTHPSPRAPPPTQSNKHQLPRHFNGIRLIETTAYRLQLFY